MAGQEYFGIGLDTDKLEQDAQKAKKAFDDIAEEAVKAGKTMDDSFSKEAKQAFENVTEEAMKAGETIEKVMGQGAQNASGKFNMLNVSIQQLAREFPTLTMSPQMFFLAISNNLTIFTDALAQARKEYEAMTAAGQKGVPVWKQVAKALLSWQTAVSLLPTLLLVFSDDIEKFFSNIFQGSKKVDLAAESLKAFKETMLKGTQDAQKEITDLNLLYNATQDLSNAVNERKKAVDKLQEQYPSYFGNMSDEEIMAGKAADAYIKLSQSIISAAKAQAARNRIVEEQSKIIENEQKLTETYALLEQAEEKLKGTKELLDSMQGKATTEEARFLASNVQIAQSRVDELQKTVDGYRSAIYQSNRISEDLEDSINIQDLLFDSTKGSDKGKKAIDNLKSLLNELLGIQSDNEERQIELTKTGTEKQLALIELRYNRQIEAVKKLQEDLKKAQGGKLTTEQQGIFGTAISGLQGMKKTETTAVENKQLENERKAMQEYLITYGGYWEKRKNIAAKYQEEIAKATTKGQKLSLQAEMTESLAKLDDEAQKKTSVIVQLFGDMSNKSVDKMRKIADQAEELLAFIEGGQYTSGNAFGITEEQFKVLSQSPEKLESIKNEIANVRNEADKAEPTFERIKDLLQKIFNDDGKDNKLEDWLNDLNGELGKIMQSVGFLSNAFSSLGDSLGSDVLSGIGTSLNTAMDAMNSAMQGAQAGAMFGPIGAAAGAAVGVVTSLVSSISQIHDKKNEKRIQQLQDRIDTLTDSYEELGRAVEDVYSKDAANLIEQQNKMLEQQKVLIQNQIKEEEDKKKTDDARIKEWQQQIDDINQQLEENKEAAIDAIFGEDIQSAIENFASAVTGAWADQTKASTAARDTVKQMMQQMVTESIKAAIQASGSMEAIRKKLQEFYADNVLSGWEQDYIYNMADELQKELDKQFGWAEGLFKDETTSTTQTATAGGFETMSQDSADELNGRFTALYEIGLRTEQQISIGNVNLEAVKNAAIETRDIIQNCYIELTEIKENTGAVVKPIQQMQKDINEMSKTIKERL